MVTIPISTVNLITILEFLGCEKMYWSVLHLWATSKQESSLDIFDLEEKTKGEFGYQLDLDSLLFIANQLEQVNECTIVCVKTKESLPNRSLPLNELREICHVAIEAVDSSYWEICLKDEELARRLVERFS